MGKPNLTHQLTKVISSTFFLNFLSYISGNELSGNGVGARVAADQYASDINTLQSIVQEIYAGFEVKPLVLGPGGFFDASWFTEFIDKTHKSLQVVTHHIYNLGAGILAALVISLNSSSPSI